MYTIQIDDWAGVYLLNILINQVERKIVFPRPTADEAWKTYQDITAQLTAQGFFNAIES